MNENKLGRKFKVASLFAGIGGFDTALEQLGGEVVFASEIDKFARTSYEAIHGFAPSGDITQIVSDDIPEHDLLTAGFPCQAFSVAGQRAGMAFKCMSDNCGTTQTISFQQYADRDFKCESCGGLIEAVDGRGLLFFEAARVARDKQPKIVLLENVKGMVGHDKGRTLDTIVRTMSEIGYVVDFEVLNSKFFGVPQNRERIFIVAVREDIQQPEEWTEESLKGDTVIPKGKRRIAEYDEVKTFNFDFPTNDTVTTRLRDVLEAEVDEKYYLDDERTAKLVAQLEERGQDTENPPLPMNLVSRGAESRSDDVAYCLKGAEGGSSKQQLLEGLPIREATKKGYAVAHEGDAVNFQFPDSKTRRGRVGKEIANTLEASNINQGVVEVSEDVRAVLTPDRLEKRQNGRRFKEVDEEMFTLTAQDRHGVFIGVSAKGINGITYNRKDGVKSLRDIAITLSASDWRGLNRSQDQTAVLEMSDTMRGAVLSKLTRDHITNRQNGRRVNPITEPMITLTAADRHGVVEESCNYRIRKLTPLECFRLQGFTDEQLEKARNAGISDSQLYKQAGNAVTVNVIRAIGERLLPYLYNEEETK